MKLVRKYVRLLLWCLFYFSVAYALSWSYFQSEYSTLYIFLVGNLFMPEAYYFKIVMLFIAYLYVIKKPFHSLFFVARCKEFYLWHIILFGLKASLFHITYTAILYLGIPFLKGVPMLYDGSLFFDFFNLFAYLFSIYLLYILILLLSGKQMLSLLVSLAINASMALIYWTIKSTDNPVLLRNIDHIILNYYAGIAILLVGIIVVIFRRKDFLA